MVDYTCFQSPGYKNNELLPGFQIDLNLQVTNTNLNTLPIFMNAKKTWEKLIVGDLPSRTIPSSTSFCFNNAPAIVDDMYVCGRFKDIPGGLVGSASLLLKRSDGTSVAGQMSFDAEKAISLMQVDGLFEGVVVHEIGHTMGLVKSDPTGNAVRRTWQDDLGCTGRPPRQGGHWNEACLRDEFMTPRIDRNWTISKLSSAFLDDIGYQVDYDATPIFQDYSPEPTCCSTGEPPVITSDNVDLSEDGMASAIAYGKEVLLENADIAFELEGTDLEYVGDQEVLVIIEENGILYDVHVTNND